MNDKPLKRKQWTLTAEQIRKLRIGIMNITPSKLSFDELMKELNQ